MPLPGEQPTIVVNMMDYPALRDKKSVMLLRLQADRYQLVLRRFDPSNGAPADPDVVPLNRAGAKAFADGLAKEIEQLEAAIASKRQAIGHLTTTIVEDMDKLDAQAKAAGDL